MADETIPNSVNINVECGASKLIPYLTSNHATIQQLLCAAENIESTMAVVSNYINNLHDAVVHIHNSHLHTSSHRAEDGFDTTSGGRSVVGYQSLATTLIHEYHFNEDRDQNGLIYGYDFMIDEDDIKLPPIVLSLHNSFKRLPKTIMSWDSYRSTLPEGF
jgi:hypothetical protein